MQTSTQPVIPSVSEHITAYCQKLEAINDSIGTDQLKGHLVVALDGFKTSALSRHEYARANVATPDAKKTIPLAFERMPGKTFDIDATPLKSQNPKLEASTLDYSNPITHSGSDRGKLTAQLASSSRSLLTSLTSLSRSLLTSASASLSPQRFADNRVTPLPPSGRWASDDRHLFTLTFDSKPLYLYKLALLVEVIHQENQSYKLLSNNCYHLLGTIVSTLKQTHSAQVQLDKWEDDAGKCCGLDIVKLGHGDIPSICQKFITRCDEFVSLLYVLVIEPYTSYAIVERG